MSDPVPAIAEASATGAVAEIFAVVSFSPVSFAAPCPIGTSWAQTGDETDSGTVTVTATNADGNSVSPANPSIAGQHAENITLQLMHFQSGIRANAVMQAMVAKLTPEDMQALGVFFAQQKAKPSAAKDRDLVAAGQKIFRGGNASSGVPACAACHSPDGAGIPKRYPRVGGQSADYTLAQLKAFKVGERGADKEGKDVNGKVMAQIASRMSEREMQAVAEFTSGLH